MKHLIKTSSRTLRIALVLMAVALGCATHAFASSSQPDPSSITPDNFRGYLTDSQGTITNDGGFLGGAKVVKNRDNTYTVTQRIGYTNRGGYSFRAGLNAYEYMGSGIEIINSQAVAVGAAPSANPNFIVGPQVPLLGKSTSVSNVFGDVAKAKEQPLIAPGQTLWYDIVATVKTLAGTKASDLDCNRSNDNHHDGSFRTGFQLTLNGLAGGDGGSWGMGFSAYSCADLNIAFAAAKPSPASTPSQGITSVTQPQVSVPETVPAPAVTPSPTPPPPIPAPPLGRTGTGSDVNNSAIDPPTSVNAGNENSPSASDLDQSPQQTMARRDGNTITQNSGTDVSPVSAQKSAKAPTRFTSTKDVDRYNSIVAMPSRGSGAPAIKNSHDGAPIISLAKPTSSHSSSRNREFVIAGLLMSCAAVALVSGKISQRAHAMPKSVPASGAPSIDLEPVVSTLSNTRLFNNEITFVDVYSLHATSREPELVSVGSVSLPSTSSISASASIARPRMSKSFDETLVERQSLTTRIWNELTKRSRQEAIEN